MSLSHILSEPTNPGLGVTPSAIFEACKDMSDLIVDPVYGRSPDLRASRVSGAEPVDRPAPLVLPRSEAVYAAGFAIKLDFDRSAVPSVLDVVLGGVLGGGEGVFANSDHVNLHANRLQSDLMKFLQTCQQGSQNASEN